MLNLTILIYYQDYKNGYETCVPIVPKSKQNYGTMKKPMKAIVQVNDKENK
jgi:hypothetical protein